MGMEEMGIEALSKHFVDIPKLEVLNLGNNNNNENNIKEIVNYSL